MRRFLRWIVVKGLANAKLLIALAAVAVAVASSGSKVDPQSGVKDDWGLF